MPITLVISAENILRRSAQAHFRKVFILFRSLTITNCITQKLYFNKRQAAYFMKQLKIKWLLLLICNSHFLFSQNQFVVYNTSNSSIPDNNIYAIAIDSIGKKWIGTENGLAVYDDATWTIYNMSNSGLP